MKKGIN